MLTNAHKATSLEWKDVRNEVMAVNPELASIIDEISPNSHYKLFKIRYPFGTMMYREGMMYLPDEQDALLPVTDSSIHELVKEHLTYQAIPLGIIMRGVAEVFIESIDRILPLWVYKPGGMLGLYETFDRKDVDSSAIVTDISAGPRSIFMVPKITDTASHARLCKTFKLSLAPPNSLLDHWYLLRELAKHQEKNNKWYFETIVFSKNWLDEQKGSDAWAKFNKYVSSLAWWHSQYRRSQVTFCEVWEHFVNNVYKSRKNLRPRQYIIDTVRHLRFIARGDISGFSCVDPDDDNFGPIQFFRDIYTDVYNLKPYAPLMMAADGISKQEPKKILYYSLSHPTLIESPLELNKKPPTVLDDLRMVAELMAILKRTIDQSASKIFKVVDDDKVYDYFHPTADKYQIAKLTKNIPDGDDIIKFQVSEQSGMKFPDAGQFFCGCIRITP